MDDFDILLRLSPQEFQARYSPVDRLSGLDSNDERQEWNTALVEGVFGLQVRLVRAMFIMTTVDKILYTALTPLQDGHSVSGSESLEGNANHDDQTHANQQEAEAEQKAEYALKTGPIARTRAVLLILFAKEVAEGLRTLALCVEISSWKKSRRSYTLGWELKQMRKLLEDEYNRKQEDVLKFMLWYGMMEVRDAKAAAEASGKEVPTP